MEREKKKVPLDKYKFENGHTHTMSVNELIFMNLIS